MLYSLNKTVMCGYPAKRTEQDLTVGAHAGCVTENKEGFKSRLLEACPGTRD